MVHAKNYEITSTFVKVIQRKLLAFFRTRCISSCISPCSFGSTDKCWCSHRQPTWIMNCECSLIMHESRLSYPKERSTFGHNVKKARAFHARTLNTWTLLAKFVLLDKLPGGLLEVPKAGSAQLHNWACTNPAVRALPPAASIRWSD